ncbi:MAG: DUF3291 domain-containing protein [Opitutus sp.]
MSTSATWQLAQVNIGRIRSAVDNPIMADFAAALNVINVLARPRAWFEMYHGAFLALWWIPLGHRPTVAEAQQRLKLFKDQVPPPKAFAFRQAFRAPTALEGVA